MDGPYVHMMKSKHLILFSICSPSIHLSGYKNTIRKLKMKPFTLLLPLPHFIILSRILWKQLMGQFISFFSFMFNLNKIRKGIEWNFNENRKEFERELNGN